MRMPLAVLSLFLSGCSFPELARAPAQAAGPPPELAPLAPLLTETEWPDPEEETALKERAAALRKRAAAIPDDAIEPETRTAMEAAAAD